MVSHQGRGFSKATRLGLVTIWCLLAGAVTCFLSRERAEPAEVGEEHVDNVLPPPSSPIFRSEVTLCALSKGSAVEVYIWTTRTRGHPTKTMAASGPAVGLCFILPHRSTLWWNIPEPGKWRKYSSNLNLSVAADSEFNILRDNEGNQVWKVLYFQNYLCIIWIIVCNMKIGI